jgi:signal transduction histidine kinase
VRHDRAAISGSVDAVLDNALKYGPEGGAITVDVRPGEEPGAIEIVVTDEGPGVDGDDVARLGDRFWRSPRHSTVPGSGLGLSIATTLLQRHGGALHVHPGAERGLVAVIRLPKAPDQGLPPR